MKAVKIVAALAVVVLLATFGITNIGGETWVTASSPLPPGWMRNPAPVVPHPPQSPIVLPAIMLFVLVALTVFDHIVNSPIAPIDDPDQLDDDSDPTHT
jgi:hypothetical protein